MTESYPQFLKIISKPTRRLDYAIIKFTSSTPSLDNAIIKLRGAHTRQWRHTIHAPFPSEHATGLHATLRRKMAELWRFEDCFYSYIHKFCNFAKLNINHDVILSNISKNYLKTNQP